MLWLGQVAIFIVWAFCQLVISDGNALKPFLVGLFGAVLVIYQLLALATQVFLAADRKQRGIGTIIRESVMTRLPALVALTVLVAVATSVATLIGVIPGIVLYVFWSLAAYVLLLEGKTVRGALQGSVALVRGWWWPMLQRFLFWFTVFTVQTLISLVPMVGLVVSGLLSLIIIPATTFYFYLTYQELSEVKGFKHLQSAQVPFAGKLFLLVWALAIFAAFVFVSTFEDVVRQSISATSSFAPKSEESGLLPNDIGNAPANLFAPNSQ